MFKKVLDAHLESLQKVRTQTQRLINFMTHSGTKSYDEMNASALGIQIPRSIC